MRLVVPVFWIGVAGLFAFALLLQWRIWHALS